MTIMTNKRIVKNTVMIALVAMLACSSFLTFSFIGNSSGGCNNTPMMMDGNGPPGMNGGSDNQQNGQPPQMNGNSDNQQNGQGTPPDMPSNDNSGNSGSQNNGQGTPPEKPDGSSNDNSNGQPSRMNGGQSSDNSDSSDNTGKGWVADSESNSDSSKNQQGNTPQTNDKSDSSDSSQKGWVADDDRSDSTDTKQSGQTTQQDNNNTKTSKQGGIRIGADNTLKYSLFVIQSLFISMIVVYLVMSGFNKKSFRETLRGMNVLIVYIIITLILTTALTTCEIAATNIFKQPRTSQSQGLPDFSQNGQKGQNGQGNMPGGNNQSSDAEASGATTVEAEKTLSENSYSSSKSDESAILVQNGGKAAVDGATIEKSGDSTNTENSEFNGINAGILVKEDSSATIKNATINTSAKGANAVFSTGENSKIKISDSTITTTGESSARGLDATYGGYIEAENVTITTKGGSCAALATDRGEGTVKASNSKLTTNGAGSPVIYSTGDISATNCTGTANGAQIAVVEGKNKATITSSKMTCSAAGNRGDVDQAGIMVYQSMSGDAGEGKGTFNATDSTLTINKKSDNYKTAPMFFVTNTTAEINLKNTKLNFGSGTLLDAEGTSEWGNSGSNGGSVTLNATNQTLVGDVKIDKISTLEMNLKNSTYKGTINGDNTAKSVKLTLDKNSKITLTGDCYVTELSNADSSNSNINFNGYKLYVNGKAIN